VAEACFNPHQLFGADIRGLESYAELFGEGPSTVILSTAACNLDELTKIFGSLEVIVLGYVTKEPRLKIAPAIDEDVNELMRIYEDALPRRLGSHD
jgi:hypothetical protein